MTVLHAPRKRKPSIASQDPAPYHVSMGPGTTRSDADDLIIAQAIAILDRRIERGQMLSDPRNADRY